MRARRQPAPPAAAPVTAPRPRAMRRGEGRAQLSSGLPVSRAAGYEGARSDVRELAGWRPGLGSADRDLLGDLPALRARSRDMIRNTPLATGAEKTWVDNIVGTGLTPEPMLDREALGLSDAAADRAEEEIKRIVVKHLASPRSDLRGELPFIGAGQRLVLRSAWANGDHFVLRRTIPRPGDLLALKLQMLEADRVSSPYRVRVGDQDSDRLRDGVLHDADGQPIGYHVLQQHPGDRLAGGLTPWSALDARAGQWSLVPRYGPESGELLVAHVLDRTRAEQTRGIPALAPVVLMLKQLGRYSDSELAAAVLSSFFTVFIKTQSGELGLGEQRAEEIIAASGPRFDDEGEALGGGTVSLGHGAIAQLDPNEEIQIANPARPNPQFDPFVVAVLRQIGSALGIPFELLIKHFTASYSASRAALLEAWRCFRAAQHWLVETCCRPVYEWAVSEAIARGLLRAPGFFTDPRIRQAWLGAVWHGPSMGHLNPLQEAKAITERVVNARVSSRAAEAAQLGGGSWEQTVRQLAKEERVMRAAGLLPDPAAAPAAPRGAAAPPDPDAPDDVEDADAPDRADAVADPLGIAAIIPHLRGRA